jgi:2-aminoadipate transaminase
MLRTEKFYSSLGASFKPGVLSQVVLAADRMKREGKKIIGLTGGLYDEQSLPWKEVKEIFDLADETAWRQMLQYGGPTGTQELREELSKFMKGYNIDADPNSQIMVTTGSQEAIDLSTRVFLEKGDILIVGDPTYLAALSAFKQVNPEIRGVKVDKKGMNTEALENTIKKINHEGKTLKLIYMVPSYQNPTTTMLPIERRKKILELAEKHDFLILEDNPYGYLSFNTPMPTPLAGLDKSGRVLYTSTFSKIVSPGMRIGWITGNEEFITKMTEAKTRISICNDVISQYVASQLFKRGTVEKQIRKMINIYRKKRDIMLEAMEVNFPEEVKWQEPQGGIFIWLKLPEKVNTTQMLSEAIERDVAYIPGSNFFTSDKHNFIRLNFSHPSTEDIIQGINVLGELIKSKI